MATPYKRKAGLPPHGTPAKKKVGLPSHETMERMPEMRTKAPSAAPVVTAPSKAKAGLPVHEGFGRPTGAAAKLTGKANALTRGNGLKLGLKKPPKAVAVEVRRAISDKAKLSKALRPVRRTTKKMPRFK